MGRVSRRLGNWHPVWRCVCMWCEGVYESYRSDSRTCSPRCRQALHRAKHKLRPRKVPVWVRNERHPVAREDYDPLDDRGQNEPL